MSTGFFKVPKAKNEPVKSYAPNSPERKLVLEQYKNMYNSSFNGFASHSILPTNKFLELDFFGSKTKGGSFIDLVTDILG